MRLESAQAIASEALSTFYGVALPARAAAMSHHWPWLYRVSVDHRHEFPLVLVADDDRVVGHAGLIPVTFGWRETRIKGAWFVDLFVLPEFRSQGCGSALMRKVMGAAPLVLAVGATAMSAPLFERLGWRRISQTFYLALPIRPSAHPRLHESTLRGAMQYADRLLKPLLNLRSRRADSRFDVRTVDYPSLSAWATEHEVRQFADARVIRSMEFLSWRVLECPFGGEFSLHTGPAGSALVRSFLRPGPCRQASILALHGDDVGAMLRHLLRWALDHKIDLIVLLSSHRATVGKARRWLPISAAMPLWAHATDLAVLDELQSCSQGWEYIDSDLELHQVEST